MRFATWIGSEGRVYVVQQEVGAALTHVRTISAWSPDSQSASLFLVLFRKP
jgi:hypothetical protein